MWKNMILPDRPHRTIYYGAENMRFACRITKARIQTYTQNMQYLSFLCCNNGYANVPQCYVLRTLPVVFLNYEGKSLNNRNFIITFLQEYLQKLFVSYFSI